MSEQRTEIELTPEELQGIMDQRSQQGQGQQVQQVQMTFPQALGSWVLGGVYRAITGEGVVPIETEPKRPTVAQVVRQEVGEMARREAEDIGISLGAAVVAAGSQVVRRGINGVFARGAQWARERRNTVSSTGTRTGPTRTARPGRSNSRTGSRPAEPTTVEGTVVGRSEPQSGPPKRLSAGRVKPIGVFKREE